jgi:hypothetical protein
LRSPGARIGAGKPKALYKAHRRFKRRMRWLKRKAYNDARSVLRKAGYEFDRLPPVLVGNLELQKRGALHAHLALLYTTPLEMTFTRAFIDAMKYWAPLCGLGYVQGWKAAERSDMRVSALRPPSRRRWQAREPG